MRIQRSVERIRRPLGLILCLLLVSIGAFAQSTTSIVGTVTDEQGGKVAGALVRLRTREGIQLVTGTDKSGSFTFKDLSQGLYLVEIRADGFAVLVSDEIRLDRGQKQSLSFELKVATIDESVVITATGTAQKIDEVAKGFTALDSRQIEEKRSLVISEALRGVPGLRVQQQGSPGALTTLRLRGQRNSDTSVLFDGLRIRDASDINGAATPLIADLIPIAIDRIEILRGSGSSIYGTNAIGGVVNIIPESSLGHTHFAFGVEGGGLGTFRGRAQASGGGNRFGFSVGVNRLDVRRGIDGNDQYGNSAGIGRFYFNPTPSIMVAGNVYGTFSNARINDNPFALPAAFTGSPFPKAVAGVTFQPDFNNPDQGRRNRFLLGSIRLSQQLNETFAYTVAYQRVSSHRRNYNGPEIDPQFAAFYPFGDFEFTSVNKGLTDTVDARVTARLGRSNLATAGFEFEQESIFQQSLPSFSLFNNTTDRQRTFAIFGQDQLFLMDSRLQLSLGIRAQSYRIRAADRPGQLSQISPENSLTGDGAIAYFIRSTNTKLRAHAGNGFRASSLFERFGAGVFPNSGFTRFGDPTLRAEQSISVDGGFDQKLASDRVRFGFTYFYTRLQRVIAFTSFASDPLGLGRFRGYVNQPGGLSRGVEGFLETSPWKGSEVRASYTFTNSDRAVVGRGLQPEFVIPRHLVGLTWNQRLRSLFFNLDVNRTGSYIAPVFESNPPFRQAELTFEGYTKVDLFASYERRLSERVKVVIFGGAENILDSTYYENGFLAPGAVGRGGVTLKF